MNSAHIEAIQNNLPKGCAYLIIAPVTLFYLTKSTLSGYWLLVFKKELIILSTPLLKTQLESIFSGVKIFCAEKLCSAYEKALKSLLVSNVITDAGEIPLSLYNLLCSCSKISIDKKNTLLTLRQIKTEKEITTIRENQKITKAGVNYASKFLKPGVSEKDISLKILHFFSKNGGVCAFESIVAFGSNSAFPHHITTHSRLRKNDVVLIDAGFRRNGYSSDLTKTFLLGKISSRKKNIFSLVSEAQKKAISVLEPGVTCRNVDAAAREVISLQGFVKNFTHSTGHGLGVEVHEKPYLNAGNCEKIHENMVVTVEPGIYIPGEFGVRLEEVVVVKKNNREVLG